MNIYGIKVESREQEGGPPSGKPINIEITSSNYEILNKEAIKITNYLQSMDGVINVEYKPTIRFFPMSIGFFVDIIIISFFFFFIKIL